MNCPNCGKELQPGDKFCIYCGTKIEIQDNNSSGDVAELAKEFKDKAVSAASNSLLGTGKNGVNFMIRRYFFGFGDIILASMICFALSLALVYMELNFFILITALSVIAFIVAIALDIYTRVIGLGKKNVDEATNKAIEQMKARAKAKFNVDPDQMNEIDPIVVAGAGASPDALSFGFSLRGRFSGLFRKLYSKDPIEAYRVGKIEKIPRYLLIQETFYAFTDTQLLVYTGNMDISTGIIYDESVAEIFYKDINCVAQQDVLKKFKVGIFKKAYYTLKYLCLDVCGIQKIAAFDSRFAENAVRSLAGMESFIREKKS